MKHLIEETIPEGLAGERVDRVVAMLADVSRSAASRLLSDGAVQVDGRSIDSGSTRVVGGQMIAISLPEDTDPVVAPETEVRFVVVHEDDHVLVVDKPAGLVVHPGAGNPSGTLVNGLVAKYPEILTVGEIHRPGIVHRLDRGTSGLLVVARSQKAHDALVIQMSDHQPERIYTALVWGALDTTSGVIDAPIGRSNRQPTRMSVIHGGRPAITHYEVDDTFTSPKPSTMLTCRLETGRTHQIRVHLSAIGHPVVGDRDYGGGRPGLDPGRPFLHARKLAFVHPVSGQSMCFESPLPAELAGVLRELS